MIGASADRTVIGNVVQGDETAGGIILREVFNTPTGPQPPVTNRPARDTSALGNAVLQLIEMSDLGGAVSDPLDGNPACDNKMLLRNPYHTAQPICTTTAGPQV